MMSLLTWTFAKLFDKSTWSATWDFIYFKIELSATELKPDFHISEIER